MLTLGLHIDGAGVRLLGESLELEGFGIQISVRQDVVILVSFQPLIAPIKLFCPISRQLLRRPLVLFGGMKSEDWWRWERIGRRLVSSYVLEHSKDDTAHALFRNTRFL